MPIALGSAAPPRTRSTAMPDLEALDAALVANERDWRALLAPLDDAACNRRPAPDRWSACEHLAHLNLVDASYLPYLDRMLADAHADAASARVPARHPWLGWPFVRAVEPPVKLRVRTPPAYAPPSALDPRETLERFAATRRALRARIAAAHSYDAARLRARYAPGIGVARFVVLSFAQWIALTAAHDRRHLWLAERAVAASAHRAAAATDA